MEIRSVTFIGVGNMGSRMARRIKSAGFDLSVYDRHTEAARSLAQHGIKVLDDLTRAVESELIIVMVANDSQVMAVVNEISESLGSAPDQKTRIVCVMSTVLPKTIKALEVLLDQKGVRLVEAPVSGGMVKAESGGLTLMLGGARSDLDQVWPVMSAMGANLFHCGDLGAASVVKIINNMIGISNLYLVAEAFALAKAFNVRCENLTSVLDVSTGRNFLTEDTKISSEQYAAWTETQDVFDSATRIVQKDLHIAQELAASVHLDLRVLESVSRSVDATDTEVMDRWRSVAQYFSGASTSSQDQSHG